MRTGEARSTPRLLNAAGNMKKGAVGNARRLFSLPRLCGGAATGVESRI